MAVFIFSDEIRTGKTGKLLKWSKKRRDVGGILTPDVDGLRVLMDIGSQKTYSFQVQQQSEATVTIGRFHFLKETFEIGRHIIEQNLKKQLSWLIIDEVGPLELAGAGFEPEITKAVNAFKNQNTDGNLLLVVRRNLLASLVEHYGLIDYQIFDLENF